MQKPVGRPSNSAPGVGTVNTPLRYCENISLNILPYSPINGGISHEDAFTIALKVRGRNVHIRAAAPGSGRAFGVGGLTGQSGAWQPHKPRARCDEADWKQSRRTIIVVNTTGCDMWAIISSIDRGYCKAPCSRCCNTLWTMLEARHSLPLSRLRRPPD
jgi:hypothetical protein